MKKRILSFLAAMALALSMTACDSKESKTTTKAKETKPAQETVEEEKVVEGGFTVSGTKLLDAYGNEFVFRGVNVAHAWYKDKTDTSLEAIAKTGANTVRIVLSDGQQWEKDSVESVENIIKKCKELDMIAILEVHDLTGENSQEDLLKTCDYWIEMKDLLNENKAYVIVNIANEWYGLWKYDPWREGNIAAITKLREAGIENTLMVDTGGWGQNTMNLEYDAAEVFEADPDKNTMFSIHFYGTAGGSAEKIEYALNDMKEQNLCVCAGEFGYNHSDGDVDEAFLMEYCEENGIGTVAWSWKGNGGGVEYLDLALEWDGSELSEDWGEVVVNGANGIKETSEICSVFE